MKNIIYLVLFLFSTTFSFAEYSGKIGVGVLEIGPELKKKVNSTPVGYVMKGKTTLNNKPLNTESIGIV